MSYNFLSASMNDYFDFLKFLRVFYIVYIVLLVILAFTSAIICCVVAKRKNRNDIGWFFAGLFFGFVMVIVIYALPELEYSQYYTPQSPLNTPSASLKTNPVKAPSVPTPSPSHNDYWRCTKCGAKNKIESIYCKTCGKYK